MWLCSWRGQNAPTHCVAVDDISQGAILNWQGTGGRSREFLCDDHPQFRSTSWSVEKPVRTSSDCSPHRPASRMSVSSLTQIDSKHTGSLIKTSPTSNFWHPDTLTLRAERQSVRMSKTTNVSLTRSGTGCFIAVPIWQLWVSKS